MKKLIIVIMILFLILSISGCQSKGDSVSKELTNDEEILNLARHIEKLDGEFYSFDIGYEDYFNKLKEIDKHLSEIVHNSEKGLKEFHANRCPIQSIRYNITEPGMSYKGIDKMIKVALEEGVEFPWEIEKPKISKVYTDKEKGFKYVFSKMDWRYTDEERFSTVYEGKWLGDMWTLRKYVFIKEKGNWKLLDIEREDKFMMVNKEGEPREREPQLDKFNGEKVKFQEVIEY
ncbi:lipoprotein [Dethiothermospora halolimnae]|uniref:LptM family lipoprotein n=1 Tax=Dethiothermospora halolimnae TaxID=3114390 RepID=UPI003CCBE0B5